MGECWGEEICQLEDVDILKDATAVFAFSKFIIIQRTVVHFLHLSSYNILQK